MKWYMLSLGLVLLMVGCQGQPETPEITIPQVTQMTEPEVEETKEVIVEKVEEPTLADVGEYFTLTPLSAEYICGLANGYATGKTGQGYVIMDATGKVVSPNYEGVTVIEDNRVVVTMEGKRGVIYPDGREIIPLEYDAIRAGGATEYYQVTMEGNVGIVDENNQILLPLAYQDAYWNGCGFYALKNGKWGLIGENGDNLTEFIYDYLPVFWEGDAEVVSRDGQLGLLDWTGAERSPFLYDTVLDSKENRFAFQEGDHCYILNEQGEVLSSGSWSEHDLHCTRSGADGIEEILDWDTGTWVPVTEAPGASSSLIIVEDQYYEGVVDENGEVILPLEFRTIYRDDRCFYVDKMGQHGAYGLDGQVLIPSQYEDCEDGGEGYFRVFDGQKWAVFGADGTQLTEFIFDDLLNSYDRIFFKDGTTYVEIDGSPYFLQGNLTIPHTNILPEIPEGIVTWAEAVDALRSIGGDVDGITTSDKEITVGEFLTLLETTTGESADDWLKIHGQEWKEKPMEGSAMIGILCDTTLFPHASDWEIAGFRLREPYTDAPKAQRDLMTFDGVVGTLDEFSDIVQYSHKGLIVHVVQMSQEEAEPYYEELAGQIVSVYITDDSYDLPRNLTVGNTLDDFWNVYGYDCDSGTQGIRISYEGATLTGLGFSGLYDPACPLVFPYLATGEWMPLEVK